MSKILKTQSRYRIERLVDPDNEGGATIFCDGVFDERKGTFKVTSSFTTKSTSEVGAKNKAMLQGKAELESKMLEKMMELKDHWNEANPNGDPDQADLFEEVAPRRPGRPKKVKQEPETEPVDDPFDLTLKNLPADPEGLEAHEAFDRAVGL